MSIQSKPKRNTNDINKSEAEKFVDGALQGDQTKSKKVLISLRFDENLLAAVDAMAERRGMSRNAIISYWCSKGLESE